MSPSRSPRILTLAVLAALAVSTNSPALEPWADARLPVTAGLQLWLDATRPGPQAPTPGPLARWEDASAQGRALLQPTTAFQPTWQGAAGDAAAAAPRVRFDGIDDHLELSGLDLKWKDFTLLAVVAPRSNAGFFRGVFSIHQPDRNDYQSGLNIDLGGPATASLSAVNVEGPGFTGAMDLLNADVPFGAFHRLAVRGAQGEYGAVQLFFDGAAHASRPRGSRRVNVHEIRLGCRVFRNEPGPPYETAFFDGDLAELLLFDRALSDAELAQLDTYLRDKHAALLADDARPTLPLHVLAPGMEVRELPVALPNINDLAYLPDGRLLALGYDGRIHLLSDTDNDGLEDGVEPYWYDTQFRSPTAMLLAPEGLYVTASGRVSLLVDTNQDGLPDQEKILATDWEPGDVATGGGVDAMGLARDAAGTVYFGLGCADYTNAYRVRDGQSHYKLASERGTILKFLPDGRREVVCTGIRFPYSLAFNRAGDLFCTDQEGETWLPGGNPLDELNHIQPGRHYGFPPRHPVYLPEVRDEPPAVAFSPQHQSTCGLSFNDPAPGQPAFGPADWQGDAFVAGYSRGKLWRCRLVKTPSGYVGRATVLAACEMLLLDVQLTPRGDLLVACHSGLPDWGTGPQGAGRLFRIRYADRDAPQPVYTWPTGHVEISVAFDRPWPENLKLRKRAPATFGQYVRPGDRYEVLRPGYESVARQQAAPRGKLGIGGGQIADSRRRIDFVADPLPYNANYVFHLESAVEESTVEPDSHADPAWQMETEVNLQGALSLVTSHDEAASHMWFLPVPSLDPAVARQWTRGSADHEAMYAAMRGPCYLRQRAVLQPPVEKTTLRVVADKQFAVLHGPPDVKDGQVAMARQSQGRYLIELPLPDKQPTFVELKMDGPIPDVHWSYTTADDPTPHPWPADACHLPWAPKQAPPPTPDAAPLAPAEVAGGDWHRGRDVFFSDQARCSACHRFAGQGGDVGADLSNLRQRDPASVLRDIREPNAAINPDYVQFAITLTDGRSLSGVVRAGSDGQMRVFDGQARETRFDRSEIAELSPLPLSLMPQDIAQVLGQEKLRDLVTFLTAPEPQPQWPAGIDPPKPRTPAEVAAVLPPAEGQKIKKELRALNVVLVASPQDHGPGEHDYPLWQRTWRRELSRAPAVRVSEAFHWPEQPHWDLADLVVMYFWNHDWSAARLAQLDAYLARGGGLVLIHSATIADAEPEQLAKRIGLAAHFGPARYRHGALDLSIAAPDDPLTQGLARTAFYDETYWPLVGDRSKVHVLATADEEGQTWPMIWTYQPPGAKGRVFASILGHYRWTFEDPLFRALLLRGMAWTAAEPPNRFANLFVPPKD